METKSKTRPQILLTNDDGIDSPGLWAAAKALGTLGYVTVAAPRDQSSGTGHSMPINSDGKITVKNIKVGDQSWVVHSVGGTPAQVVLFAAQEIMPQKPDLVVSGINYGENIGDAITISGTVGAALEAASLGIPAMAVSLQMDSPEYYYTHSTEIDFSVAAHFTRLFAKVMLEKSMPDDVDVLKIDVPSRATLQTPWRVTRLSRKRFFVPFIEKRSSWEENGKVNVRLEADPDQVGRDSDIFALVHEKVVAVTPLSTDMTSRVDFENLSHLLDGGKQA